MLLPRISTFTGCFRLVSMLMRMGVSLNDHPPQSTGVPADITLGLVRLEPKIGVDEHGGTSFAAISWFEL